MKSTCRNQICTLLLLSIKGANFFSFFFSSDIWGHLTFIFCRYFKSESEVIYLLQSLLSITMRVFNSCRYFFHHIQRAITVYFSYEVFSLSNAIRIPSHNISVLFATIRYLKTRMERICTCARNSKNGYQSTTSGVRLLPNCQRQKEAIYLLWVDPSL